MWTGFWRRLVPRRPLRAPGAQQEPAEPPAHRRAWVLQLRGRRPQQLHAEQPVIPVPRRYRRGCSLLRGRADPVALGCRHRLPCATTAAAPALLAPSLTLCWMCQCTPGHTAGAEGTDLGAQNVVYRPVHEKKYICRVYFAPSQRCHGTRFSQMNGLGLSSRGSAPLSICRLVGVRSDHASG
eukprot:COSAG04_NODE_80_length_28110_cov_13.522847_29_plen_182_part_00